MADILYAPDRERVITTNAWAFLHWLRIARGIDLADWSALQRYSAERPDDFRAAVAAFARLPAGGLRLARHAGAQEALVLRRAGGARVAVSRDELRHPHPNPLPQAGEGDVGAPLRRLWPAGLLIRPMAELLLHADLRPDDGLLVVGATWPWLAALLEGTTVIVAAPADLLASAAEERATVLVAPAQMLGEAAFHRARRRPDLAALRTIIATGGPLSPEGRTRIYTWVKSDVLLLARSGDTFWGNPLEPVLARPPATPAFLTPRPSGPAQR
jgi:hypothetical protein